MKPTNGVLIGVAILSGAIPLMAGALVWSVSSSSREEPWLMSAHHHRSRWIETQMQGPPVQPPGTTLVSVPITPDMATSGRDMTGYKVMVLAHSMSGTKQKEVVLPVVVDALVMSVEAGTSASGELVVTLAVPDEQLELLMYALDTAPSLHLKTPPCGGWLPSESDGQVFLAAAKSTDDLLAVLTDE